MKLQPLVPGTFIERFNRFTALVKLDGATLKAHIKNSGRLRELLVPGNTCYVRLADRPFGKTGLDLVLLQAGEHLACIDTSVSPALVLEALRTGVLGAFSGYRVLRTEPGYMGGRFDLLLNGVMPCFVETKCVTLVENGLALFPDAPTRRGVRHMERLREARREGYECAVVFVVQHSGARRFDIHRQMDPEFEKAVVDAAKDGVRFFCCWCRIDTHEIRIEGALELRVQRRSKYGVFSVHLY